MCGKAVKFKQRYLMKKPLGYTSSNVSKTEWLARNTSIIRYIHHLPLLNPLKLNVFSHPYQLDQSISILRVLGGTSHFYSNFKRTFCLQIVENLIRRRILRRLIWFCTVCRCATKRTLGLYGLNPHKCTVSIKIKIHVFQLIPMDTF